MSAATTERATERQCEDTILEAAATFGWLAHATRPAPSNKGWRTPIRGNKGFPDLVLVRGSEILFVELKRKPNRVEPDQTRWLGALSDTGRVEVHVVWVPEGLQPFLERLARR